MATSSDAASHAGTAVSSRLDGITRRNFQKLMPLLVGVYIISFIDRTNIGMAKVELGADIGLSAAAYGLGAGLFFISYSLLEIPSNLMLERVGARMWIARIMLTWGIISAGMALVQGPASFYTGRVLLGAAEAGLYPGIILYITYWFPRIQRAKANGIFLLGVSMANIIGAPLAGLLLQLDGFGGLQGWQWMFAMEGIPAVALAFVVWFKLPDRPTAAKWLSVDDKALLLAQLDSEDDGAKAESGGIKALLPVIRDRQLWLIVSIYFTHQIAVYSLSYFLPSIIGSYGKMSSVTIGLLTALPWTAAAIGGLLLPRHATTLGRSKLMISFGLVTVSVGLTIAATSGFVFGLIGFSIAAFAFFVIQSVLFTFPPQRLSGAALAGGIGFVNCLGLLGGFLGPTVMGALEEKTGNPSSGLWFIIVLALVGATLTWGLKGSRGHQGTTDTTNDSTRPELAEASA